MLNLNIYAKYRMKFKDKYSYQNEDGEFRTETLKKVRTLNANEIIDFIKLQCDDNTFMSLSIMDNKVFIEKFDPMHGDGSDIELVIEEIKEKETCEDKVCEKIEDIAREYWTRLEDDNENLEDYYITYTDLQRILKRVRGLD